MARFLKRSLAASEPSYLVGRRGILIAQQVTYAGALALASTSLREIQPVLGWTALGYAIAMVAVVPGIWLASDLVRRVAFGLALGLAGACAAWSVTTMFHWQEHANPILGGATILLAGHSYWFLDPETVRVFQRVRERRAERSAAAAVARQSA